MVEELKRKGAAQDKDIANYLVIVIEYDVI